METGAVQQTVTDRPNNGDRPSVRLNRPTKPSDFEIILRKFKTAFFHKLYKKIKEGPFKDKDQLERTAWSDGSVGRTVWTDGRFGRTDGLDGRLSRTDGLDGRLSRTDG
ncbi:hypothetical protein BpHYR1_000350 [Brachionus plicatilis]|uniref:Uncharacterized protein n=1 Tax=Brachionus plicatilis TaxID=10195 RepID=A0A3M7SC29_BRAPC|nr:hypothetical protein BpHYR1_000350 [Brachionus plicatilis]